jgi:beta-mannosidase
MIAAGCLDPLEKGNRVYQALNLECYQWWYRRTFQSANGNPDQKAELVFDGLDCIGTVWLNGTLLGHPANMLVPHRFDVSALLLPNRANELVVRIDPAVPVGFAAPRSDWERANPGSWESLSIRKAPHMYGWDVMPRIVSAGLWRGVRLEWSPPLHFSSVYWFTRTIDVEHSRAVVSLSWEIAGEILTNAEHRLEVVLRCNGHMAFRTETVAVTSNGQQDIQLDNARLWWPRGYGEPTLYEATITLRSKNGDALDQHVTRLGIRTVELDRSDIVTPEKPGNFGFVVNGIPIFVKGANWTPLDALHSRDPEHLSNVFPMLLELNCNMVRCWGGNVYEQDRFFDLCDEAGILVWQDFAMACAAYPQDEAFLHLIALEAEALSRRLRNHPSLALWCGNNECDDALNWSNPKGMAPVDPNRDRISRKVLPGVLGRLDPHRSYLPASPYHSPAVFNAGNETNLIPDVHLWGPRGYFKAPFYTDTPAHFASEIGYHGCPSRSSLERMFDTGFVYPWVIDHEWNDEWLTKSVRYRPDSETTKGRNDIMIKQIAAFFGSVPNDLDEFILASQLCQGEGLKFFIESWRQQKGRRRGILWWNLRDGWPIVSDSVVDYYNTKKLAFRYIQSVQRDVQVICCEATTDHHPIIVVNDTLKPVQGRLEIRRAGSTVKLFEASFSVVPNGKTKIGELFHPTQPEMWLLNWSVEGATSFASHYLTVSGPIDFKQYKRWIDLAGILLM